MWCHIFHVCHTVSKATLHFPASPPVITSNIVLLSQVTFPPLTLDHKTCITVLLHHTCHIQECRPFSNNSTSCSSKSSAQIGHQTEISLLLSSIAFNIDRGCMHSFLAHKLTQNCTIYSVSCIVVLFLLSFSSGSGQFSPVLQFHQFSGVFQFHHSATRDSHTKDSNLPILQFLLLPRQGCKNTVTGSKKAESPNTKTKCHKEPSQQFQSVKGKTTSKSSQMPDPTSSKLLSLLYKCRLPFH